MPYPKKWTTVHQFMVKNVTVLYGFYWKFTTLLCIGFSFYVKLHSDNLSLNEDDDDDEQ